MIPIYTILVNNDNELLTTVKERIMQKSKLVDSLRFLVDPIYKDTDMTDFTVTMEYRLPVSKEYHFEILTLSEEKYKEKLEYTLPFDTALTKEAGDIEIQLSFASPVMQMDGTVLQYVRKTSPTTITIIPINAWSEMIPDNILTPLDQRLLKLDAQMQELLDVADAVQDSKADDITFENNKLQLTSNGKKIGVGVDCDKFENDDHKNITIVDF